MTLAREIKRRSRAGAAAAVFLALTVYFGTNVTRGELGLRAYARRQADLLIASTALHAAEAERDGWQLRVEALQPSHLDTDALDERARATLGLATANEIVVPVKN